MEQSQVPVREEALERSIPWSAMESWMGVLLLILLNVVLILFVKGGSGAQLAQSALIVFAELAYILPVVVILAWKRIPWKYLGFGKFNWSTIGIGCGFLIGGYGIIYLHNIILTLLGIDVQGEKIVGVFDSIDSPVWLIVAAVLVAPLVEEIFFRGFLFQGFRKKYGWVKAMLLSSAIFGIAHIDPVTIIPTFVLGLVLTYVYHRSNSVWPGIILHFLINTAAACSAYMITQLPKVIPS